ncbi:50S ribosomal protein L33 [candidate division WWE3 bacterium CG_4_9_14_0_2_um_filter_35_11]|uniref:Large ribosomal subunit protein bL33 n=1 Tax=candidate division WWE3 bacterium CG_4_9_14_0_2_um_filter_35_11 TaxID=1975077 RepID=A0A2M8EM53_UNCKA|nr:MAG: 50S ribosomal protein L33 [candidate division WWE3 bacterium CG10_big_fil_rev_8_21_14_0_10_35_32]PJC23811.1 MAG: 50S ribosomal protein L33 [candidate division WWE3 bacterium CG_4_9_14_0_2_um_filter_35_11]
MAKKGQRQMMLFVCGDCNRRNYITEKNKINTPDKLEIKKFCKWCRKRTVHKENAKLK